MTESAEQRADRLARSAEISRLQASLTTAHQERDAAIQKHDELVDQIHEAQKDYKALLEECGVSHVREIVDQRDAAIRRAERAEAHAAVMREALESAQDMVERMFEKISLADYEAKEKRRGVKAWERVAETMFDGTMASYRDEFSAALSAPPPQALADLRAKLRRECFAECAAIAADHRLGEELIRASMDSPTQLYAAVSQTIANAIRQRAQEG